MAVSPFDQFGKIAQLSKNRTLSQFNLLYDLDNWMTYHQDLVNENWYLYDGLHQLFFRKYEEEDEQDFFNRVQFSTIENHIQPIIDLMVSHLYGDGSRIKRYAKRIKTKDGSIEEELDTELMEFFETRVWNNARQATTDDGKALNTLVTGYTLVERELIDIRTNRPFTGADDKFTKAKFGVIRKKPRDSSFSYPLPYIDENGIIDPTRLGGILTITEYDDYLGNKGLMQLLNKVRTKKWIMEYVNDDVWLRWQKKERDDEWQPLPKFNDNRNPYRDINIPFTIYRNTGDPHYLEGDSEVSKLKSINLELNELGSGDKETITYHQNPVLVGRGGATLPNDFVRTKDAFVGLQGKEAMFEYLTWDGNLQASDVRQNNLRRSLSTISGMSLISRGFLKDIGQIRSGPPLKALFTSERSVMTRKFAMFRQGEIDEMMADIRFFKIETGTNKYPIDPTLSLNIDFDIDFLGIDKLLDEEIKALQKQAGTEDVYDILRNEHPDWSEQQIEESVKEIKKSQASKQVKPKTQSPDAKAAQQE